MQRTPTLVLVGVMLVALVVIALATFAAFHIIGGPEQAVRTAESVRPDATIVPSSEIGGPFALVDHDGAARNSEDFIGKYVLLYFGYAFCPDVCPTTLATIARAMDDLGDDAERVVPVFITVDPKRDTPEVLKSYVAAFHPRMVGLTGSRDAVDAAASAFRVYHDIHGDTADGDYVVDHSSFTYLLDPSGELEVIFRHNATAEAMAAVIESYISRNAGY